MTPIIVTTDRHTGLYVCRDPRRRTNYVTDDRDDAFSEARKWAGRRRTVLDKTSH